MNEMQISSLNDVTFSCFAYYIRRLMAESITDLRTHEIIKRVKKL
jgi:hypothetical protein